MDGGDVNFKQNNESKAYIKVEAESANDNNDVKKKEVREKISPSKSKLRRKTKKLKTLEEKDLTELDKNNNYYL